MSADRRLFAAAATGGAIVGGAIVWLINGACKKKSNVARTVPLYQVDAFSSAPFHGNPAAVCLLPSDMELDDETMLRIAAEMNLSETAFVRIDPSPKCEIATVGNSKWRTAQFFSLRWFTPHAEVPLCGHATMATAAVLFYHVGNCNQRLFFSTTMGMGQLSAGRAATSTGSVPCDAVCMELPVNLPCQVVGWTSNETVLALARTIFGDSSGTETRFPLIDVQYSVSTKKMLLRLDDTVTRAQLELLRPKTNAMVAIKQSDPTLHVKGVIVTVKAPPIGVGDLQQYDFFSRYFAPWVGIAEDPVTGSAHTVLAPYWSTRLGDTTVHKMMARQCSPRGGDLMLNLAPGSDRLSISGDNALVFRAEMHL